VSACGTTKITKTKAHEDHEEDRRDAEPDGGRQSRPQPASRAVARYLRALGLAAFGVLVNFVGTRLLTPSCPSWFRCTGAAR
jgi:hypothetical protein